MLRSDHSAFSSGSPYLLASASLRWLSLPFVAALALATACTPKIGDECTVSTNCSAAGDRLCDITQPGGYCTIFNCEPGTCPEDSVCINFGTSLSTVDRCTPSQGNSPYQRSFCMASCGSDGDCRGGYKCLDLSGALDKDGKPTNQVGAVLAENSGSGKVCSVPWDQDGAVVIPNNSNAVCLGSTSTAGAAGATQSSSAGAGGTGGTSGDSGAAGESGAGG